MTKRPLCMVCLVLMLLMCVADRAGFPLIRGNPVPENVDSWIREHPKVTICGEVTQTTENEFSQSDLSTKEESIKGKSTEENIY